MTTTRISDDERDGPGKPLPDDTTRGIAPDELDGEEDAEADGTSVQDWVDAENSRPTLPDETADGLDDMEEEVRHQAEDLPSDTPGRV